MPSLRQIINGVLKPFDLELGHISSSGRTIERLRKEAADSAALIKRLQSETAWLAHSLGLNSRLNSEFYDEEHYEGRPKKSGRAASTPRSGSTLLWDGLIFRADAVPVSTEMFGEGHMADFFKRWGQLSPEDYLSRLFQKRTSKSGIFGVKVHHSQYPLFSDLLSPGEIHPILIERRDKLDQAVSYCLAEHTQQWCSLHQAAHEADESIYDYHKMRGYLQDVVEGTKFWCGYFSSNGLEPQYVVYEDFAKNYQGTIASLASWITGTETNPADIRPPGMKVQRTDLNKRLKEQLIRDLWDCGCDPAQFQTLLWPDYSVKNTFCPRMRPKGKK